MRKPTTERIDEAWWAEREDEGSDGELFAVSGAT